RKLDRERDAIEAPADLRDQRRLGIAELELAETGRDALDEELRRGIGQHLGSAKPGVPWRAIQRIQPMDLLVLGAKRLAAGGEDMQPGGLSQQGFRQRR